MLTFFIILLFNISHLTISANHTLIASESGYSYNYNVQNISDEINYFAIIIGIEHDEPETNVELSNISAYSCYQALLSGINWKEEHVHLLLDENASKEAIRSSIINWLDPLENKDDIIFFYYNGRIEKTSLKNQIIEPASRMNDIMFNLSNENVISDQELDTWFDQIESQHIYMVLDTDYASYMSYLKQRGRNILASTGIFFPRKDENLHLNQNSIVSYFLSKGFEGYADMDYNGVVDAKELFSYAKIQTYKYCIDKMKRSSQNLQFHIQIPYIFDRIQVKDIINELSFRWRQISNDGFGKNSNYATRGMEIFKNELYIGTQNNIFTDSLNLEINPFGITAVSMVPDFYSFLGDLSRYPIRMVLHLLTVFSQGCEVWKYNYTNDQLIKVIGDESITGIDSGFGSHFNAAASVMKVYNDYLYVGTWNTPIGGKYQSDRNGCEIWRTTDGLKWEQVVGYQAPIINGGFGNPDNTGAWSIQIFNDYLYVGTMNWDFSDIGGCEVWRTNDGIHWEKVVDHGFRPFMSDSDRVKDAINTYAWIMQVYNNELYMGTFNSRLWLWNEKGTGCQLWKTADGIIWEKVELPNRMNDDFQDGFGEGENYGIRRMVVYNDELYVGVASSFFHDHGCEIWKYDGVNWCPVISDDFPGALPTDIHYDGFGNIMNKYIWSMTVTEDNVLWIGTANGQVYLPFLYKGERDDYGIKTETQGFEIWSYNGIEWNPVIKNDIGLKPNGFGDSTNLGARNMIEYPKNSGNLIVGTFKLFNTQEDKPKGGCELWMRHVFSKE
jgi:hypothetical protein